MNVFAWLTRRVRESCTEGLRQFFADVSPDSPPQTIDELRALVAAPAPALPAPPDTEPDADTPAKPPRKRA